METKTKYQAGNSAFSLIELLAVVATIAIIGAAAIAVLSNTNSTIKISKLGQDVARLNTAVNVFISNGGSLEGIDTAQNVINELKKATANEKTVVGMRGSSVDLRLQAVTETDSDLRQRANWKDDLGKFVLEKSTSGVREFVMNDALADINYADVARDTNLVYNGAAGWVWKASDYPLAASTGPSSVPTLQAPTLGASGGTGSANNSRLGRPIISPESDTFALSAFPLQVTITKAITDQVDSIIYYSIEPNIWVLYSGPFSVDPGTSVVAYSSHEDPMWDESAPATATYNNNPESLQIAISIPMNPITYAEAGGALEEGDYTAPFIIPAISIALTAESASNIPDQYENSQNFQFFWTYNGSDPLSSSDRHDGGQFGHGIDNNGHGNNYSGVDISNPAYIRWAEENGIDLSEYDDEIRPHTYIDYTITQWDGSSLLPIQVVAQSGNSSVLTNSSVLSANIIISRTSLPAPSISYDEEDTDRGDTVEIDMLVDSGVIPVGARIYYTTDGTDPGDDGNGNPLSGTLYTGVFDPLVNDSAASDALIIARVYPPADYTAWFKVSEPANSTYSIPLWEISGTSTGWFSGAEGPSGMVSNFGGDNVITESSSYFQWGDSGDWGVGANWLDFNGTDLTDVENDERFLIGQLDYFNGTIAMDSAASRVDFAVQLEFNNSQTRFDYGFDLLATANDGTAQQNADYIWFNNTESVQTINLYGTDYSLNLEFGETSAAGFSSIDQFHVLEGQSASANIYATLVSLGSWW